MTDVQEQSQPKVHGVPQPKGTAWLNEVKVDAARNAVEHVRKQIEDQEYERQKAEGVTPDELVANAKQKLGWAVADEANEPSAEKAGDVLEEAVDDIVEDVEDKKKTTKSTAKSTKKSSGKAK